MTAAPPPDAALLAVEFLVDDPAAISRLDALLDVLLSYRAGRRAWPRGAARRKELTNAAKAIAALRRRLDTLEPLAVIRAMQSFDTVAAAGVGNEGPRPPSSGRHRGHALEEFAALCSGLARLEAGLQRVAAGEPVCRAGREPRDDVLAFGIESLLALWHRFRHDRPTQSVKRRSFGAFAEAIFTTAPFNFTDNSVRHAVAALLPADARVA